MKYKIEYIITILSRAGRVVNIYVDGICDELVTSDLLKLGVSVSKDK